MSKLDLKKQYKKLFNPSPKEPVIVSVPNFNFLMIDGEGDPNTSKKFQLAVEALYSVSYKIKFMIKKKDVTKDYSVPQLEGLWWCEDMSLFSTEKKDFWKWTLMIIQPEYVGVNEFELAIKELKQKKNYSLPSIRLEKLEEGLSAQIMHIGPFATEYTTIKTLHDFIKQKDYKLRDKHHEIYLSDPRKCKPEKMKTIIRQPII
jgi:hypothetical protein